MSQVLDKVPRPEPAAASAAAAKVREESGSLLRETVVIPASRPVPAVALPPREPETRNPIPASPAQPISEQPVPPQETQSIAPSSPPEAEQTALEMPAEIPWRMVGELYNSYILVEQGEEAFLIDKHAAHERILFEKLKANQETISSQSLISPISVRLSPAAAGELLANQDMLDSLGFSIEEFGENTLLIRQIPMDLGPEDAASTLESLAADLLNGRRAQADTVRDELLHTVACKAAIKAGWKNDEAELLAVAKAVMSREDLKYCPHGRPICVTLSKKQLEKQFKRT